MSAVLRSVAAPVAGVETQVSTVQRIRDLEARADAAEDEAIACKYEAARLIFEELERREGGARALGEEIGKSHTHVLRMEAVHRKHGNKPYVTSLSAWNKLYKGDGPQASPTWPRPRPSIRVRTAGGSLAQAIETTKLALRLNDRVKVARTLIEVVGEDAIRRALDPEADMPDEIDESEDNVEPDEEPNLFGGAP